MHGCAWTRGGREAALSHEPSLAYCGSQVQIGGAIFALLRLETGKAMFSGTVGRLTWTTASAPGKAARPTAVLALPRRTMRRCHEPGLVDGAARDVGTG